MPGGDAQIRDIYTLRTIRPKEEIAAPARDVIGPAEELFWRGLVQEALMARYGRWTGAALAAMAYGGVHIVTGNFTLFGAAGIAGAHWCALYAAGVPLGALVVSHVDLGRLDLPGPADGRDRAGRAARGGLRRLTYGACRCPCRRRRSARLAVVSATTSGLVTCPSKSLLMNASMSSTRPARSLASIMLVSENESISFRYSAAVYVWSQSQRWTSTSVKRGSAASALRDRRFDVRPRRRRRILVRLSVPLVDRLRRGEEPSILGRVDLEESDDRQDAARAQDQRGSIELGRRRDPVVRTGREDGVGALRREVDRLEVPDAHPEALGRKVRAQPAGHRRADLDGMDEQRHGQGDPSSPGRFPVRPPGPPAPSGRRAKSSSNNASGYVGRISSYTSTTVPNVSLGSRVSLIAWFASIDARCYACRGRPDPESKRPAVSRGPS